jgi:anti-anti-sigma factor
MSPFGIEEHTEPGGRRRLRITGELDLATCSELAARLAAAAERREQVLLDIHDLEFMDSTGLRLLLEAAGEAARDGWNLTITRPPHGAVLRLLELTGTLDVLPVADPS